MHLVGMGWGRGSKPHPNYNIKARLESKPEFSKQLLGVVTDTHDFPPSPSPVRNSLPDGGLFEYCDPLVPLSFIMAATFYTEPATWSRCSEHLCFASVSV